MLHFRTLIKIRIMLELETEIYKHKVHARQYMSIESYVIILAQL